MSEKQSGLPPTSVSLLRCLQSQDRQAQSDFVSMYQAWILSLYIRHMPLDDATDLTQDTLIRALEKIPDYQHRGTGSFRGWLSTIVRREVARWYAERTTRVNATGGDENAAAVEQLRDPTEDIADLIEKEHNRAIVERSLKLAEKQFSPRAIQAFRLRHLDRMSAPEVAEKQNLRVKDVYVYCNRVLSYLRDRIDELMS